MGLYETPAFLFDEDVFKERAELIKEALGDNIPLCFSIKANPFLLNFYFNSKSVWCKVNSILILVITATLIKNKV